MHLPPISKSTAYYIYKMQQLNQPTNIKLPLNHEDLKCKNLETRSLLKTL